jgi:chromosome segregation ATPase
MSSNQKIDLEETKIEESKDENGNKISDTNKNLYIKYIALKNALIEERKKTSLIEKENNSLKEDNNKKEEIISELKDEIKKYHDIIDKKENSNFFSELFQNMNISDIKNEVTINKLTKEKIELQEKISELNQELIITKKNLEQISSQKKELEEKINLYKIDIKTLITKSNNEKENLYKTLEEYKKRIINLQETIRVLSTDKKYFEENVNKLKEEIKLKNEEREKIFQEQENIINNNTEFKQKIKNLKNIINQYKKAIDNTIEINENYVFIGKIIPNTHYNNIININNGAKDDIFLNVENKINKINNKDNYENIRIMFNFNQKKLKIYAENKNINIDAKNIIDIVENLHIEGQIKIFYKIKDNVFDYLCQFTKKEADYIIRFYKELKNNDIIDPALYAAYLGTQ